MENKTGLNQEVSNSIILEAVVALQQQIKAMQENHTTKNDLADMEERIMAEIRPIGRAVDKDAVTVIDHERRIHNLEMQAA